MRNTPQSDPTVALRLLTYGDPREVGDSYEPHHVRRVLHLSPPSKDLNLKSEDFIRNVVVQSEDINRNGSR